MKTQLITATNTTVTITLPETLEEWTDLYSESMLCHLLEKYYLSLLRASIMNWKKKGLSEAEIQLMAEAFVPTNLARRFEG